MTISEIGELYRNWYIRDRGGDLDALKSRLEQEREQLQAELAELLRRQEHPRGEKVSPVIQREGLSQKRAAKIKALRRRITKLSYVDYLNRTSLQAIREHVKYFAEFEAFLRLRHGTNLHANYICGEDLRHYYDHVQRQLRRKKVTQKWANARYQAVTIAFRRAKKLYPDASWPQGFFGVDGTLAILNRKDTVTEGQNSDLQGIAPGR